MTELQNCLPEHARLFFIRLRNLKWDESRQFYQGKLSSLRREAAARGSINSGAQVKAEWDLATEHIGNLAWGYFQAGIETCTLYEIHLTKSLCQCIEAAIKEILVVQQKNAVKNAAMRIPGAPPIPLASTVQQLESGPLPRYNEILIARGDDCEHRKSGHSRRFLANRSLKRSNQVLRNSRWATKERTRQLARRRLPRE